MPKIFLDVRPTEKYLQRDLQDLQANLPDLWTVKNDAEWCFWVQYPDSMAEDDARAVVREQIDQLCSSTFSIA